MSDVINRGRVTYTSEVKPEPPSFKFEHNREKCVFVLTDSDGKTGYFRDNSAKYLMVEADGVGGAMCPVTKYGRPVVIYLCREERELWADQ
jgi:hypothetical protein